MVAAGGVLENYQDDDRPGWAATVEDQPPENAEEKETDVDRILLSVTEVSGPLKGLAEKQAESLQPLGTCPDRRDLHQEPGGLCAHRARRPQAPAAGSLGPTNRP